jgi:hypothetical protein
MRLFTNILLLLMILGVVKLNTYTQSPHLTPAESHVLKTITYGVGSGVLINTVCAMAAPAIDPEIPASDSFTSCAPFGLAGSLIVARVHVFTTGGWGAEQWWYLNQLPKIAENAFRDLLGFPQKPMPSKPVMSVDRDEFLGRAEL